MKSIVVAALLLISTSAMASELSSSQDSPAITLWKKYRVAQNSDCKQAKDNATTCWQNWNNMGGGTDGQAGSFRQCMQLYCTLLASHGCDTPKFCD